MPSKIEWTDESWPVVTGCSHAGFPGCDSCYAARMAATRLKYHPRYAGLATFSNGKASWTGEVRLNRDVLDQPLHWKKPRMVFVASMGDLFHPDVSDEFILEVFITMYRAPQHIFQLLTKRPRRMMEFLKSRIDVYAEDWYRSRYGHVWMGTSVENQAAADERIPQLLQTPAAVRFVSVEPMLEAVNITDQPWWDWRYTYDYYKMAYPDAGPPIDWVICGGESGPGARPMHPDWARSLRDQCQVAGVPFFFKAWGAWLPMGQGAPECDTSKIHMFSDLSETRRVGKKRAGHLLDGRAWQEFPVADGAGNR